MTEDQDLGESNQETDKLRWPIGFMLLVGITAVYLAWRLVQGIGVLIGWITG